MLILLLVLNYSCRKTVTCSPPDESTIKAMESKWIHYNKNDTLIIISNKNDTNILYWFSEGTWQDKDDETSDYPCAYSHNQTFKSNYDMYSGFTYRLYNSETMVFFDFNLMSNGTFYEFCNGINPDITYYDSLVFNNKPFYEVYKFQNTLPTYEYNVYFSPSDGLIKISVNNDSLYFMPKEYW